MTVSWKELEEIERCLHKEGMKIKKALQIFTEEHRDVRQLRSNEAEYKRQHRYARERIVKSCEVVVASINESIAPIEKCREQLLKDGCRKDHPDVRAAARRTQPYFDLISLITELRTKDPLFLDARQPGTLCTKYDTRFSSSRWIDAMQACGFRRSNPWRRFLKEKNKQFPMWRELKSALPGILEIIGIIVIFLGAVLAFTWIAGSPGR